MAMVEDDAARTYQPRFVLYQSAVLKYVDEPAFVPVSNRTAMVAANAAR